MLFAISIEPLAQLIRDDNNIKGIIINREEHKISLYADDVLLYFREPISTIHYKELISRYGYYSGYKVNVDKTEAMDVNSLVSENVKLQSGFKWPREGIKYLGIHIPQSLHNLYDVNYNNIIRHISNNLERWPHFQSPYWGVWKVSI